MGRFFFNFILCKRLNYLKASSPYMKYVARVEIGLKPGHSDPEGETTKQSLMELNYPVKTVKVRKVYEVHLEALSSEEARRQVEEMCRRLLANPVKDNYKIQIEEAK